MTWPRCWPRSPVYRAAAFIYTPNGNSLITSATAYDKNNRKLNTVHLP